MHLKAKNWMHSEKFAESAQFLREVVPGRLIRQEDILRGHKFVSELIAIKAQKQGISLAAANLMNGRNIAHLLTPDNVLFSEDGDIILRATCIPGEKELEGPEYNHLVFRAWHDLYFGELGNYGLLGKSANQVLLDKDLSPDLIDLRSHLYDSASIDKRLITNHQAQMYPEERDLVILLINQFLRNEAASTPLNDWRRSCAGKIFMTLGSTLVPQGLYGIHPMIDYWLAHGKNLGQLINLLEGGAVASTPPPTQNDYLNGKGLVAVMRTSLLHPFGPLCARRNLEGKIPKDQLDMIVPFSGEYSFEEVSELTHYKVPMFGPTAHHQFLEEGLHDKIEVNKSSKPDYLKWTDVMIPTPRKKFI